MANLLHSILPQPRRPIVFVHPDVSIAQCITIMVDDNIGALVVTDDINLLGIVSERDIICSLHRGLSPDSSKASDILYAAVSVLKPTNTVEEAMQVITTTKRRHILVSDGRELLAVLSIGDILCHLLEDRSREIEHLENYIHTY